MYVLLDVLQIGRALYGAGSVGAPRQAIFPVTSSYFYMAVRSAQPVAWALHAKQIPRV